MAKPNYSFAKRQKELAKKAKKEEKKRLKAEAALNPDTDEADDQPVEEGAPESPSDEDSNQV